MVHHNPSEDETKTKYLQADVLKKTGFNGQVIKNINLTASYENASPGTVSKESSVFSWIETLRIDFEEKLQSTSRAGIAFFSHIDPFIFPKLIVDRHREEISVDGYISIYRDKTVELLEDMFDEVVGRYPDMDGFIIRTGETYLLDYPYHTGNNPVRYFSNPEHDFRDGEVSVKYNNRRDDLRKEIDNLVHLIDVLKRIICVKHNKILIFRTWDVFKDRFHADLEYYLSVTEKIEPHEKLFFSIKHTKLDFQRNVEFNPCIGSGRHKQLIEIQFQREYEGKGAFPNYFAHHLIDGFPEIEGKKGFRHVLDSELVQGVFCWSRGGGWFGPYVKNEFWIDLNLEVFIRWLRFPGISEETLFSSYLEEAGFDSVSIKIIREIACLSSEAVLAGRYCSFGEIDKLWMRDDVIGGLGQLGKFFEYLLRNQLSEKALREKEKSVSLWREIAFLSEQINHKDDKLRQFIVGSCQYGLRLFTVVEKGWKVMFSALKFGGCPVDIIDEFYTAWDDYRSLVSEYSEISTLYRGKYWNWPGEELTPGLLDSIRLIAGKSHEISISG